MNVQIGTRHVPAAGFDSSPVGTVLQPREPLLDRVRHSRATARSRRWLVSNPALLAILCMQALLSLRLRNTPFQDEALYLHAGHRIWLQWLHGAQTYEDYEGFFSGWPYLYPPLAAPLNDLGGIEAARALSLVLMLGTTLLVHSLVSRWWGSSPALLAAFVFAASSPTFFLGHLATYDALAVWLLTVATWLSARGAEQENIRRWLATFAVVALVGALAVAVKYAALLYVPVAIALPHLAAARNATFRETLGRVVLAGTIFAVALAALVLAVGGVPAGVTSTTTDRATGADSLEAILTTTLRGIGPALVLDLLGAWPAVRALSRDRGLESRVPWWRSSLFVLGGLIAALLASAYQAHLATTVSLHKHVGFGLLFIVGPAGVLLDRVVRAGHHRNRQLGIVLVALCLVAVVGVRESSLRFRDWPNSTRLVEVMATQVRPADGRYLVEEPEVPQEALRDIVEPYQWSSLTFFAYTPRKGELAGKQLFGDDALRAAVLEGYFDLIVLRFSDPRAATVAKAIDDAGGYELIERLPADNSYGRGTWSIWRRE